MLWLKRNLFFSLSLLVIVGFFGYGCFYLYSNWAESAETQKALEETDANLRKIYDSPGVFPSKTNITLLRDQEKELKQFIASAGAAKTRIEFDARISPSNFKTLLDNSLAELNKQADASRITVGQRDFSFSAIKPLVSFPEGSVPLLAEELADIKGLCAILFRSEITSIDNLRRIPVCKPDMDAQGSLDYHPLPGRTNDLTADTSMVYLVTFQGFSESLASVLDNIQRSPNGLSIRLLTVGPGNLAKSTPVAPQPAFAPQPAVPFTRNPPPGAGSPPLRGGAAPPPARRLDTLADEKAFRVSMVIEITKPMLAAK
jgi:hypothetical protein